MKTAIPIRLLPIHVLDGPAADLEALGQLPLAHSLRPLSPDVLSLLLAQAGPSAGEPPLGPCLGLACDRALPDGIPPPLAEGQHHLELEFPVGGRSVEVLGVDYGRGQNPTLGRVDIQIDSAERHPRDYQDWRHRDCPLTPNLAGTLNASVQAEFRNSRPSHAP